MNERIRLLYDEARLQAKSIDADIDPKGWMDLYHEKFAELIVIECAKQLDVYKMMKLDSSFYSSMLREHFGAKR